MNAAPLSCQRGLLSRRGRGAADDYPAVAAGTWRCNSRATSAATPPSASNGGTSPPGLTDAAGAGLRRADHVFSQPPAGGGGQPQPFRAAPAAVRACRHRRSATRPPALRPARRARRLWPRRRGRGVDRRAGSTTGRSSARSGYRAQIAARDFRFDLRFAPTQAPLLQGDAGFSRKGPDPRQSSAYYSEPQLARQRPASLPMPRSSSAAAHGSITNGRARSWPKARRAGTGPASISPTAAALMAFRMRDHAGGMLWAGGSLRAADGRVRRFEPHEIRFEPQRQWRSPRTGVVYPVAMTVDTALDELRARTVAGRPGARCATEHRRHLLGRRGARDPIRTRGGAWLSRAHRIRHAA